MTAREIEYRRQREDPRPGDAHYLHLLDLRRALSRALGGAEGRWLDFGSHTSPYRSLLPAATVETADLARGDGPAGDHALTPEGRCDAPDSSFDGVLSTQVLEHVPAPQVYLREAFRLLRPGGRLVLTTHGIWEDHPDPLDVRRWTAPGLRFEAEQAGFDVRQSLPVTCGPRALLVMFALLRLDAARRRGAPPAAAPHAGRRLVDRCCERLSARHWIGNEGRERLYVALMLEARRPA